MRSCPDECCDAWSHQTLRLCMCHRHVLAIRYACACHRAHGSPNATPVHAGKRVGDIGRSPIGRQLVANWYTLRLCMFQRVASRMHRRSVWRPVGSVMCTGVAFGELVSVVRPDAVLHVASHQTLHWCMFQRRCLVLRYVCACPRADALQTLCLCIREEV